MNHIENLDLEESLKNKLEAIWERVEFQNSIKLIKNGYAAPKALKKNALMFIGLNPSFSERSDKKSHFYELYSPDHEIHSYFKKFPLIANSLNLDWAHLDLLYLRQTNQRGVEKLIRNKVGLAFIVEQYTLSKKILEESCPKIIVVNNSFSRKLFGYHNSDGENTWMGYNLVLNQNWGTHEITNKNSPLNGVPVFFTSMLSGQRALDLGFLDRLLWHLKFVKNQLEP